MIIGKIPTKIAIQEAPGKGRGAFAIENIKEGETVEVSPVVLYGYDLRSPGEWSSAEIVMHQYHNWGPWTPEASCTSMVLGYGAMYNHSDEPNIKYQKNIENLTISFIALRDIEPGEECCHRYATWNEGLRGKKI